jgi:hypothetical protein
MSSQGRLVLSQRARIIHLEAKIRWAAEQFMAIGNAIADNSTAYAHSHAITCSMEMDPDWEGYSTGHLTAEGE